jgi:hypothetical protein
MTRGKVAMNVFGIVPEKNADGVFLDRDPSASLRDDKGGWRAASV